MKFEVENSFIRKSTFDYVFDKKNLSITPIDRKKYPCRKGYYRS